MLRVVFFGANGDFSARAARAIASEHRIVAVVRADTRAPMGLGQRTHRALSALARRVGLRPPRPLSGFAAEAGLMTWVARSRNDPRIPEVLADLRPDMICIAGYPWLLPREIYADLPLGAVNLHPSLLPRHRGVLPLFWIYHADDRETGVTVHRVTERADAGAVVAQEAFPLPRGFPVELLNQENAQRGAILLCRAITAVGSGAAIVRAQDEARATLAPRIELGRPMVDFVEWDVERVWHFLAGLSSHYREPLHTADGATVRYREVAGYQRETHASVPGAVSRRTGGWTLYCRGGTVQLC